MKFFIVTDWEQHQDEEFKALVPAMREMQKLEWKWPISRWDARENFSRFAAWAEENLKGRLYLMGHLAFCDHPEDLTHFKLRWGNDEEA